jgi:hypothetical protein
VWPKGQDMCWYTDHKMTKRKRTNNDLQNATQETRLSNMNLTKTRGELMCFFRVSSSCSTSGTYPLDKVVALTRSPGTKNYFMDMGKKWLSWNHHFDSFTDVSSSCSTSGTHRGTLVTNPVKNHEWRTELWLPHVSSMVICDTNIHNG